MIDPSIIDAKIVEARQRDEAVTQALLREIARLPAVMPNHKYDMDFDLNRLTMQLVPGRFTRSGDINSRNGPPPENGSFAYQLYSAICFVVDARAELKLLELIASPHFYAALMKSAGMTPDA